MTFLDKLARCKESLGIEQDKDDADLERILRRSMDVGTAINQYMDRDEPCGEQSLAMPKANRVSGAGSSSGGGETSAGGGGKRPRVDTPRVEEPVPEEGSTAEAIFNDIPLDPFLRASLRTDDSIAKTAVLNALVIEAQFKRLTLSLPREVCLSACL